MGDEGAEVSAWQFPGSSVSAEAFKTIFFFFFHCMHYLFGNTDGGV